MICTVSTVKDRLENVRRFVSGNLANGVDHMVVFLEDPEPAVLDLLDDSPHVTAVVADAEWWGPHRPQLLNKRQRTHANLVQEVAARVPGVEWVFHIDGDEVALLDRAALAKVPPKRVAVGLTPLEVVSTLHADGPGTRFKRLLEDEELQLLLALGLLPEASNSRYFRSHIVGKAGARPGPRRWLGIHKVSDPERERIPLHRHPGLRLLHYESYSGDDFVRKWSAMVGSGPKIHFGEHRQVLADALKALLAMEVDEEVRLRYLTEVYHRHMEDPVEVLAELGLLEEIDPLAGAQTPRDWKPEALQQLRDGLDAFRGIDKRILLQESYAEAEVGRVLDDVSQGRSPRRGVFRR